MACALELGREPTYSRVEVYSEFSDCDEEDGVVSEPGPCACAPPGLGVVI